MWSGNLLGAWPWWDGGESVGTINTPDGNTVVTLDPSYYGLQVVVQGLSVDVDESRIICTGNIEYIRSVDDMPCFHVTGDGTITIDSIDYDS